MQVVMRFDKFKATTVAAVIGGGIWCLAFFLNIEVYEKISELLKRLDSMDLDEILIALILILIGLLIDFRRIKRERERTLEIFQQKHQVFRSTIRTTQHIVNNFLLSLQAFCMQAENCKDFPPESIRKMDLMIHDTALKLRTLANLTDLQEREIFPGFVVMDMPEMPSQEEV
jgi:hypothetical protein